MGCITSKHNNGNDLLHLHNLNAPNTYFVVNVDNSGNDLWTGTLALTERELTLYRKGKPSIVWPINALRRYGFNENIFSFEAGRRCQTGEGIYAFRLAEAENLTRTLENYINLPIANRNGNNNNNINNNNNSRTAAGPLQSQHSLLLNNQPNPQQQPQPSQPEEFPMPLETNGPPVAPRIPGIDGGKCSAPPSPPPPSSTSSSPLHPNHFYSNDNYMEPLPNAGVIQNLLEKIDTKLPEDDTSDTINTHENVINNDNNDINNNNNNNDSNTDNDGDNVDCNDANSLLITEKPSEINSIQQQNDKPQQQQQQQRPPVAKLDLNNIHEDLPLIDSAVSYCNVRLPDNTTIILNKMDNLMDISPNEVAPSVHDAKQLQRTEKRMRNGIYVGNIMDVIDEKLKHSLTPLRLLANIDRSGDKNHLYMNIVPGTIDMPKYIPTPIDTAYEDDIIDYNNNNNSNNNNNNNNNNNTPATGGQMSATRMHSFFPQFNNGPLSPQRPYENIDGPVVVYRQRFSKNNTTPSSIDYQHQQQQQQQSYGNYLNRNDCKSQHTDSTGGTVTPISPTTPTALQTYTITSGGNSSYRNNSFEKLESPCSPVVNYTVIDFDQSNVKSPNTSTTTLSSNGNGGGGNGGGIFQINTNSLTPTATTPITLVPDSPNKKYANGITFSITINSNNNNNINNNIGGTSIANILQHQSSASSITTSTTSTQTATPTPTTPIISPPTEVLQYSIIDFNKTVALSNSTTPNSSIDDEGSRKTRHSSIVTLMGGSASQQQFPTSATGTSFTLLKHSHSISE